MVSSAVSTPHKRSPLARVRVNAEPTTACIADSFVASPRAGVPFWRRGLIHAIAAVPCAAVAMPLAAPAPPAVSAQPGSATTPVSVAVTTEEQSEDAEGARSLSQVFTNLEETVSKERKVHERPVGLAGLTGNIAVGQIHFDPHHQFGGELDDGSMGLKSHVGFALDAAVVSTSIERTVEHAHGWKSSHGVSGGVRGHHEMSFDHQAAVSSHGELTRDRNHQLAAGSEFFSTWTRQTNDNNVIKLGVCGGATQDLTHGDGRIRMEANQLVMHQADTSHPLLGHRTTFKAEAKEGRGDSRPFYHVATSASMHYPTRLLHANEVALTVAGQAHSDKGKRSEVNVSFDWK